ncbi:GNAT family N-acetyltransferase [[Clostridium] dakarense]|uniref:GNAT family N-acetyltransferase n=1 Tax=Faecalimicrobium dakarense TaxID=1301100 RepID=UPI0004B4A858|nr:GNAT family N-acetyltransferase [[Clostridium] dakarense]
MEDIIIETNRLILRKISKDDYREIANILQDIEVMYAWEKSFSDEEVQDWIDKNLKRYNNEGYSYFLAINKEDNKVIGVMGPLIENIEGEEFIGVAYILNKDSWGMGYATEGVDACIEYAFNKLNAKKVIAQIRPSNTNSCNVAKRLNMKIQGKFIKVYDNKKMEHLIYSIERNDYLKNRVDI